TAFMIAAFRAEEKKNKNPLFKDSYSKYYVNDEMKKNAENLTAINPESRDMIRYRIRYFDDKISEHIERGTEQIVLLGGGFDMRACKYAHRPPGQTLRKMKIPTLM
ncbi:MAG: class I SAM-dependent methyltransferase, partial [Candidatus Marinimicrobia bacterium]|nr:class I SAM-dependent methyltransferase [Candidatus Neomarinimicrobiota bacterium]